MDCLKQKEFLQWNTRTKDHLCANFQDIWLSPKSWILDIKYAISTIKMQISNQFFRKKFHYTILSLYVCQVFSNVRDHLHFFLHFVFSFMGELFMDDPISLRIPIQSCRTRIFHDVGLIKVFVGIFGIIETA